MTEKEIIEGCCKHEPEAQRELYEQFSAVMFGVCLRYVKEQAVAEDLLHDGFITVFTKIREYRGDGSFQGWCRRIFVNTALGYLRKNTPTTGATDIEEARWLSGDGADAVEQMSENELLGMIGELSDGYRTVLNLYAVEGYSHKEIGEMLGISENTSRSQYFRARNRLMEVIEERRKEKPAVAESRA